MSVPSELDAESIATAISSVLEQLEPNLPPEEVAEIRTYLTDREIGIALETLCAAVMKAEVALSVSEFDWIARSAQSMEIEQSKFVAPVLARGPNQVGGLPE